MPRSCCNPLGKHDNTRRIKSLKTISTKLHNTYHAKVPALIEGEKLCVECYMAVINITKDTILVRNASNNVEADPSALLEESFSMESLPGKTQVILKCFV